MLLGGKKKNPGKLQNCHDLKVSVRKGNFFSEIYMNAYVTILFPSQNSEICKIKIISKQFLHDKLVLFN